MLSRFFPHPTDIVGLEPLGEGNINDTYLVTPAYCPPVVFQRINSSVFADPVVVVDNGALVSAHLRRAQSTQPGYSEGLAFFETIHAAGGGTHLLDDHGDVWRMISYIDTSVNYELIKDPGRFFEVGRLLGCFHRLLNDFDHTRLTPALPGFHDLGGYCSSYLRAAQSHQRGSSAELDYCTSMVRPRLEIRSLEQLNESQRAPLRVIHGDPKRDNFLFNRNSSKALSLIDLDTVASGLLALDLGDCLRSLCNQAGEKTCSLDDVHFDIDICRRFLAGYRASGMNLSEAETDQIYHGARLLTFELGLRFLTDYLNNDRYFKVSDREENLRRAQVQFRLLESIELQRGAIESAAFSG